MKQERRIANTVGIYSLWFNWIIAVGSLAIIPIISLYISKSLLPIIFFVLEVLLYIKVRHNVASKMSSCLRLPHIAMVSLFWSLLIILLINLYNYQTFFKIELFSNQANKSVPFIPILILAPITCIVALYNLLKGYKANICRDCYARHGAVAERGFLGKLFSQEGVFLTQMLLMLSFSLSVLCWGYYLMFHINTNINDVDKFMFVWLQFIVYIVNIIYLGIKYFSLWLYYQQEIDGNSLRYNSSSLVRYIIICDEYVFLKTPNIVYDNVASDESLIDTPARLFLQYKTNIIEKDAIEYFSALSGIANAKIRFLYKNTNFKTECNIFHYVLYVDEKETINQSRLDGDWYKLSQIKALALENRLSHLFISELERIYTIAMAWKTFDRTGRRLYKIKNYKPTFHLKDLKDWDVDYNDIAWLFVSVNNEDCPFFNIRKFWNKYICGISFVK